MSKCRISSFNGQNMRALARLWLCKFLGREISASLQAVEFIFVILFYISLSYFWFFVQRLLFCWKKKQEIMIKYNRYGLIPDVNCSRCVAQWKLNFNEERFVRPLKTANDFLVLTTVLNRPWKQQQR